MTLGRQLILSGLLVLFGLFIGMIVFTINNTQTFLNHQLASHSQDTATVLGLSLTHAMEENDTIIASRMVDSIWDRGYYRNIEVESLNGAPIVSKSMPVKVEGVPSWFINTLKLQTQKEEALIQAGWRQAGKVYVESNPGFAYKQIWSVFTQSLVWFCVIAVFALGLGLFMLHIILKPLREVTKQAYAICNQQFLIQEKLPWTIDLKQVVLAMNNMSSRLKLVFEEQTKATEALREQAFESPVTGLGNRRFFDMALKNFTSEDKHTGGVLLLVELQNFKQYNDEHGYEKGDELLKKTALTIQQACEKQEGAQLSHMGGAGFGIILPNKSATVAQAVATDILKAFADYKHQEISTQSDVGHIGICEFMPTEEPSEILSSADIALRAAQSSGPNQLSIHKHSHEEHTKGAREWAALFDAAVAAKDITLYFQPFDVFGPIQERRFYEALIRMKDETGNLMPAGQFMPMAEHLHKVPELDRLVIEKICERIQTDVEPREYSINLSASSLDEEDFRKFLIRQIKNLGKKAQRLMVELPEYGVLHRVDLVSDLFKQLKNMGAQTVIDHFGQNFTSFGYLHSISLSYLKIDGSFVRDLPHNEENQFFIRSLIGIAHSLDVKVIAEAVETDEELQILKKLKVDGLQGYLIGKPGQLD